MRYRYRILWRHELQTDIVEFATGPSLNGMAGSAEHRYRNNYKKYQGYRVVRIEEVGEEAECVLVETEVNDG